MFWILTIVCTINTVLSFVFLKESYGPTVLEARKKIREDEEGGQYRIAGQDDRPFRTKLGEAMERPFRILFTQPIVLAMATYQALLYGTTFRYGISYCNLLSALIGNSHLVFLPILKIYMERHMVSQLLK